MALNDAERVRTPLRVGMMWHSPNSGNLGVGALTLGNMELARRAAARDGRDVTFELIGFVDPGRPYYVTGDSTNVTGLNGKAMVPGAALDQALARCDVVLDIGGGDSFTDIYGAKRFFYLAWSKLRVLACKLPLVLSPQTIGPFDKVWSRAIAARIMARARRVVARDPKSFAVAREMAPRATVSLSADVAFAMPYDQIDLGPGTHVGINVSGLLFNGGYSGANEFGLEIDYPLFVRKLIGALLARKGVTVHLVPHVLSDALPKDDDRSAIRTLVAEFPDVRSAPDFSGPIEAKSFISGLDLLIGGRMHACIAAYSSGTAVVPVAYSRKFSGLFEDLLDYPYLVPVTGMSTDRAVEFVLECLDEREALGRRVSAGKATIDRHLADYVDTLADLFTTLGTVPRVDDRRR